MDEEICRKQFEAFYIQDVKGVTDCPVPWGHSWVESRWKFWRAAWLSALQHISASREPDA